MSSISKGGWKDLEGLQTMRVLARNMAFFLRCKEAGLRTGVPLPAKEIRIYKLVLVTKLFSFGHSGRPSYIFLITSYRKACGTYESLGHQIQTLAIMSGISK